MSCPLSSKKGKGEGGVGELEGIGKRGGSVNVLMEKNKCRLWNGASMFRVGLFNSPDLLFPQQTHP